MAQGDLFDISAGGHGFHISSHLIAVLALFIAIFAIAGFSMFRSNSVPDKALKQHGSGLKTEFFDIDLTGVAVTNGTDNGVLAAVTTLPAQSHILESALVATQLANTAILDIDLALSPSAGVAVGNVPGAGVTDLASTLELGTTDGTQNACVSATPNTGQAVTTAVNVYLVQGDTDNTESTGLTSGKVRVMLRYITA